MISKDKGIREKLLVEKIDHRWYHIKKILLLCEQGGYSEEEVDENRLMDWIWLI